MPSLAAALVLAGLHAGVGSSRLSDRVTDQRWLSAAGGVAIAYVFVHLLPWLAEVQEAVVEAGAFAWLERHVYVVALLGVMTFYALEQLARRSKHRTDHGRPSDMVGWVRITSYTAYNGIIGYVLPQPDRGHGSSLWLFTFAMAVHFLLNDAELREHHGELYHRSGRWIVSLGVLGGWLLGRLVPVDQATLALPLAFIAGVVVLNVMKQELPEDRESRLVPFVGAGAAYAVVVLVAL